MDGVSNRFRRLVLDESITGTTTKSRLTRHRSQGKVSNGRGMRNGNLPSWFCYYSPAGLYFRSTSFMTNADIARLLRETAALTELTGGNAFRARALRSAARTIRDLDEPATDRLEAGTLTDLSGIGSGVAGHIKEIRARGSFAQRDALLEAVPPGLPEVLRVKGLGTKKVRRLWKELGITSLDELEAAAESGRLAALSGFGPKTQQNVLAGVRLLKKYRTRRRYPDALAQIRPLLDALRPADGIARAEPAGALRRKMETVRDIVIVVAASGPQPVQAALDGLIDAVSVDEDTLTGTLPDGFPLRVHAAPPERFGTAWWRVTGSAAHATAFVPAHGTPEAHTGEAAVYKAAGLPFIPPELREGRGELTAAAEGALPDLVTFEDLRGALHNHSTYSDGADTLREMAEAARAMGLSYFGICDHSQSLAIAGGLSPESVARQHEEIRFLNEEFASDDGSPFRIFSGIESDILKDGSLDYEDEVLETFDLVVASVHQGFSMTEQEATRRLVRAVENPHTAILGHVTGRLLLQREGYPVDHEAVIEACARCNVAIELNANPYRLDMDWRYVQAAAGRGVLIAINPDAHATGELAYMRYGAAVARKGWLTPEQCLNARSLDDFAAWLGNRNGGMGEWERG